MKKKAFKSRVLYEKVREYNKLVSKPSLPTKEQKSSNKETKIRKKIMKYFLLITAKELTLYPR